VLPSGSLVRDNSPRFLSDVVGAGRPTARPWPRTGELPDRRWMREFSGSPLSRRPSGSRTSIEPAASAEVPAMGAPSVITIELCLTSGRWSRRSCSGGGVDCELVRRQNRPSPQSPVARRVGAATAVKVPVGEIDSSDGSKAWSARALPAWVGLPLAPWTRSPMTSGGTKHPPTEGSVPL
jgi:hypothetical protein